MKINTETIEKIKNTVGDLFTQYTGGIQAAIENEGNVSIGFPVKIVQNVERFDVQIGINFVKARIKDGVTFIVTDQLEMFQDATVSMITED
ncbi:MAG: hypothetical protein JRF40_12905 [Deltaproteobacteria bacterium]|nr:hypothetical protein [Deltaproteobacteria bacterium]